LFAFGDGYIREVIDPILILYVGIVLACAYADSFRIIDNWI